MKEIPPRLSRIVFVDDFEVLDVGNMRLIFEGSITKS